MSMFVTVPASGDSFQEAKKKFRRAFSSSSVEKQKEAIRALAATGEKEAFRMIENKMYQIAKTLWNLEHHKLVAERKSGHHRVDFSLTGEEKQARRLAEDGKLKQKQELYEVGTKQLRNMGSSEWILGLAKRWGLERSSLTSVYALMKGKPLYGLMKGELLKPLGRMKKKEAVETLLKIFWRVEQQTRTFLEKKNKIDRKIYSFPQNTPYSDKEAAKLTLKRLPYVLQISSLDVLRKQIYESLTRPEGEVFINALIDSGLHSKHWPVRAVSAYALGAKQDESSKQALVDRLSEESRYQVQIELLK